jgi:23S rRNA (cytidine1920-2'-O)/16S rRNA (cytidine1409-2'-O)-methyltransferase
MQKQKVRLDHLLVQAGLAESSEKARALILAGRVFLGAMRLDKPGTLVTADAAPQVRPVPRFVGRGGDKLQGALDFFGIRVDNRVCVDFGTSTGGFVDCLLQSGAARVYTFDVGPSQMAWKLARDARVIQRDRCNVRNLRPDEIPESFFLVTADLSFISLRSVFPALAAATAVRGEPDWRMLLLVKPQFELPASRIARGGVVKSAEEGRQVVDTLIAEAGLHGLTAAGIFPSALRGAEGNQEYFVQFRSEKG